MNWPGNFSILLIYCAVENRARCQSTCARNTGLFLIKEYSLSAGTGSRVCDADAMMAKINEK